MTGCDIGLIGLAVMGQNLALNMERNGYRVAVFNRTQATTASFMERRASGKKIVAAHSPKELLKGLKKPRVVVLMVKAGPAIDEVIGDLRPFLEPGDLLMDGGNSHFQDTERRFQELSSQGIRYLGVGISGGEEGALWGPSIMPGGDPEAYRLVQSLFEAIAAKVDGEPCVTYIGPRGSGHYVKMIHNAIEYGDMELIAESYDLLHRGLGLEAEELRDVFSKWNEGPLSSYLIEITAEIFKRVDTETGRPLVDLILDRAQQKGTGRWTSQNAFDLGVPTPTLTAAVEARMLSARKAERLKASTILGGPEITFHGDRPALIPALEKALYASKICSYAQGMALLKSASDAYGYNLKLDSIARIWRGGCIIRAKFLDHIRTAFRDDPDLPNLLVAPFFREALLASQEAWRQVLEAAIRLAIPTPAMSASLAYFDAYRSARLPANLIQAQRDFFGAHTYERIDREGIFHTDWSK